MRDTFRCAILKAARKLHDNMLDLCVVCGGATSFAIDTQFTKWEPTTFLLFNIGGKNVDSLYVPIRLLTIAIQCYSRFHVDSSTMSFFHSTFLSCSFIWRLALIFFSFVMRLYACVLNGRILKARETAWLHALQYI